MGWGCLMANPEHAGRVATEWLIECDKCGHRAWSTRRPKVGTFHWNTDGKCYGIRRLFCRTVTAYVEVGYVGGVSDG